MCFFGGSFFKIKVADILNFQWIKYFGKSLSFLRNEVIGVNYCWISRPLKLLLPFTEYRLDQPNNKHIKTAVIFWKPLSKEIFDKSLKFFDPSATKLQPCKFFVKLNGNRLLMANLNSSSINKPYLRAVEYAISYFFEFFFTLILMRFLSKTLWKNCHF